MQVALITALSLHVLSSVFWAGSSFTLARTGGVGGEQLFRPQMAAEVVAILTGGYLGHLAHGGAFSAIEQVLGAGAFAAIVAAGVQGAVAGRALGSLRGGAAGAAGGRARLALAPRIAPPPLARTAGGRGGAPGCVAPG